MAQEKRTAAGSSGKMDSGVLLAKVVGYLDPAFMGGVEVTLLRDQGNSIGDINQTYVVKYSTPFYGVTAYEYMGLNKTDYNDTQKSYGMWFPTPEIGTTVMVVFVDGNPADGYVIGCVPGRFMNHMVPAIGASTEVELSPEDKKKYDTSQPLPVAEVNRKTNDLEKNLNIDKLKKPVHPIADRFLEQGLLEDDARGPTTSTSRRSVPNMVFGISTPGPVDRRSGSKKQFIGKKQSSTPSAVPVSRLGGSTLVFDDGDDRYQRKTSAGKGPVAYADVLKGEKGEPTIPYGEYFRVRTRTGHQLLMHNSEDLIYIGNARGTTWIELTSNGKIDIYAEDSVSIHTQNDLNIRADRDINLEAGRNVNIKALARMQIESGSNTNIVIGAGGKITTAGALDVRSGGTNKFTSGGDTHIKAANTAIDGGNINLNSGVAGAASSAMPLSTHTNVATSSIAAWAGKNRYNSGTVSSIMKRIPMHEPWALHENQAPNFLTPADTDREA